MDKSVHFHIVSLTASDRTLRCGAWRKNAAFGG
jgi:hypothetical protein